MRKAQGGAARADQGRGREEGGCFSGCGTAFALLLLIALAVKYWYISLGIVVLVVAAGAIANSQQKQRAQEAARRRSGPRDPWLNEVAVALGDLGLSEVARNTGQQLGGAPLEGDIGLQEDGLLVYVNLFANPEIARQAEIGLRAQSNIRTAMANGQTDLKTDGPVVLVANGRGRVVDEYRMAEVEHAVAGVPLPPALKRQVVRPPSSLPGPLPHREPIVEGGPLEQIQKLAKLRDAGALTDAEFEAKKAELLRRL